MTNAYGVYQDYYVRTFLTNYSPSTIGWIGSVQLFFQFSFGIIAGRLFDGGYFYHMMIGASTLYVFSYYMLSLAQPQQFYQVFLSQGIAAGIGLGFLFLPSIGVVAHHFRRRRSFAMGIVVSGSSCGGLVFPVMLKYVFPIHSPSTPLTSVFQPSHWTERFPMGNSCGCIPLHRLHGYCYLAHAYSIATTI